MVSRIGELISANPGLVRGLAVAGAAFTAIRVGVLAATVAVRLMGVAFAATPIGIIAVAIAAAAGLIMANWEALAPYFQAFWAKIQGPAKVVWEWMKAAFAWTPLGMIIENWQPLGEFFGALWEVVKALSVPFFDFLKKLFDWTPLGMIIKNWEPISAWFQSLWTKLKPILEPMMKLFGGGDGGDTILQTATSKANQFAEEQRQRNAGAGGGNGSFLAADASDASRLNQQRINQATGIPSTSELLSRPNLPAPGSLLQAGAAGGKAQLQGELVMRFEGAPPGMRVDPAKTNQPGLTVTPSVGYRTLGNGGKP
jgi:hypothetical protein